MAGARAHVRAALGHRAGRRQLAPHADVCAGKRAGGAAPHLRVVTLAGIWPEVASASGKGWYLSTCQVSCFGLLAGFACLQLQGGLLHVLAGAHTSRRSTAMPLITLIHCVICLVCNGVKLMISYVCL